jgi:uncharacterized repeat protein (TIGR03803 family)
MAVPSYAQTYSVLYDFVGGAVFPNGELIQDSSGNLYGTTTQDLYNGGCGVVFELDPNNVFTILHKFVGTDGCQPIAGLLRDEEGNLYGTTSSAGKYGGGTVFKLDTNNTLTTLHDFGHDRSEGWSPRSRLITINGYLYGVTETGGTGCSGGGCGVVFKMTKHGTETVLYRFTGGADGGAPQGLIQDTVGNLYGVADATTAPYGGTVWKLGTSGVLTVLYTFTGGSDGGAPIGRLIRDTNGNIHGVTAFGGDMSCYPPQGCGTVYRLDASGNEKVLHRFHGGDDGFMPYAGLLDVGGTLYGTNLYSGDPYCPVVEGGCGVIFQISKTGQFSTVHAFTGPPQDGGEPFWMGELTLGTDGSIYGATTYGGSVTQSCPNSGGCGAIFKYTP